MVTGESAVRRAFSTELSSAQSRSRISILRGALLLLTASVLSACGSISLFTSQVMPDVDLAQYDTFYVAQEPGGKPFVRDLIVEELRGKGFTVNTGELGEVPIDSEVVLRFTDNWVWDPTAYLGGLSVQLFDTRSGLLVATGHSMRTTLSQTPAHVMVTEVIGSIFDGELSEFEEGPLLEIPTEDLLVLLSDPIPEPIPLRISMIGYGEPWLSSEVLTGGVLASLRDNNVFAETLDDGSGEHTLLVVITDVNWGSAGLGMSVSTQWQLYRSADQTIVWQSEIDGSASQMLRLLFPEDSLGGWENYFRRSLHKIVDEAMTQLSELELDSAGS